MVFRARESCILTAGGCMPSSSAIFSSVKPSYSWNLIIRRWRSVNSLSTISSTCRNRASRFSPTSSSGRSPANGTVFRFRIWSMETFLTVRVSSASASRPFWTWYRPHRRTKASCSASSAASASASNFPAPTFKRCRIRWYVSVRMSAILF